MGKIAKIKKEEIGIDLKLFFSLAVRKVTQHRYKTSWWFETELIGTDNNLTIVYNPLTRRLLIGDSNLYLRLSVVDNKLDVKYVTENVNLILQKEELFAFQSFLLEKIKNQCWK